MWIMDCERGLTMKCPYRVIKKTDKTENMILESIDFQDCLKEECPYFGRTALVFNERTCRNELKTLPKCRKVESEAHG